MFKAALLPTQPDSPTWLAPPLLSPLTTLSFHQAHMLDGDMSAAKRFATLPRSGGKSVRATSKALIENCS